LPNGKVILLEVIELVSNNLFVVSLIELCKLSMKIFETLCINDSLLNELLRVQFEDVGMVLDLIIHQWLGKVRHVLLIVAVPSISNDVDKDILLEALAIFNCDLHAFVENIRLIGVHMDYWSIHSLRDLSTVIGRTRLVGIRCESNLIVYDDMNNSSRTIVNQILEAERLPDNTLTSNCSVSVDQYSKNPISIDLYLSLLSFSYWRALVLP
jgi:hypothetical protein